MMGNSCFFIHNESLSPFTGPHMKQKLFSNSNMFFQLSQFYYYFLIGHVLSQFRISTCFFNYQSFFRTTTFSNGGSCRMLVPTS